MVDEHSGQTLSLFICKYLYEKLSKRCGFADLIFEEVGDVDDETNLCR